jgi:hypothetical protein
LVEAVVRPTDEVVAILCDSGGAAAADGDGHVVGLDADRFGGREAHSFAEAERAFEVRTGENDKELFASPAPCDVSDTKGLTQSVGEHPEDDVAAVMALGVVDMLEMVDVEQDDREGIAVARGDFEVVQELSFEVPAVRKTGEHVGSADLLELEVALPQVGLELFDADGGADASEKLGRFKRLFQVVVSSAAQPREDVVDACPDRQEHDRDLFESGVAFEEGKYFEAVEARHFDVEQDDIGGLLAAQGDGGRTVLRFEDVVSLLLEAVPHDGADNQRVVRDEHC